MARALGQQITAHDLNLIGGPFTESSVAEARCDSRQATGILPPDLLDASQSHVPGKGFLQFLACKFPRRGLDRVMKQRQASF
jgi:hypothetical protein